MSAKKKWKKNYRDLFNLVMESIPATNINFVEESMKKEWSRSLTHLKKTDRLFEGGAANFTH